MKKRSIYIPEATREQLVERYYRGGPSMASTLRGAVEEIADRWTETDSDDQIERAQIKVWIDEETWILAQSVAQRSGRSLSDLIREEVTTDLAERPV